MAKNFDDLSALKQYASQINAYFNAPMSTPVVTVRLPRQKGYHLHSITGKIEGGQDGVTQLMRQVFGKTTTIEQLSGDLAKKISGKYDAYAVTLASGGGFYFRSQIGERGALTDKDLTPTKLGLAGKSFSKTEHARAITMALRTSLSASIPLEILELCGELLERSSLKGAQIPTSPKITAYTKVVSPSDLKKLGKNFGEVIIANWCLYNKPDAERIEYPLEEANPLADFIVHFTKRSKKAPLNVSAKFEGGANASVKSIIPPGSTPPEGATTNEILAYDAIMAVTHEKIIPGLLHAEEILQTPEYQALKKMIRKPVTLESISALVERALGSAGILTKGSWTPGAKETQTRYEMFLQELAPFYSSIGGAGQPDIRSIPKIAALGRGHFYHPILYAFSVALAKRFNTQPECTSILEKAARSIKAEQLYLDLSPSHLSIRVKKFEDSRFLFAQGALSYEAGNVRMKVHMVK